MHKLRKLLAIIFLLLIPCLSSAGIIVDPVPLVGGGIGVWIDDNTNYYTAATPRNVWLPDDVGFNIGNVVGTPDASIYWNTVPAVDEMYIDVNTGNLRIGTVSPYSTIIDGDVGLSGELDMTGAAVAIDLNPAGTGTQNIIDVTPSAALDAGSTWLFINFDGSALDPATGAMSIAGILQADFSGFASVDGNAVVAAFNAIAPAADGSTLFRVALTELTADKEQKAFLYDGGTVALSATGTYEPFKADFSNVTRDGGAPVLHGTTIELPADYTGFGANYAGYFSGAGDSVTFADGTYAANVTGEVNIVGANETSSMLNVKQTPTSATTNFMVTLEADGTDWSGGGVLKIISDDSSAMPLTITDGSGTTSTISRTGTISLNNHVELLAGGDIFSTANGSIRLLPNGWGHTIIETEDTKSALLIGNADKMGPLESVTRNGTTTLTKNSHGLSLGNGDLVQIESANGRGFYRLVSFTADTLVVDRVVAGSASDIQLVVYKDVISFFHTDGTNGNWMRGNSHQDKPLQIGGDTLKDTSGLGSEDVVIGGNLGIGEIDFADSAGPVTLSRMNIAAGGTAGDEMSILYSIIEDNEGIKHYCEDDSAGAEQNCEMRASNSFTLIEDTPYFMLENNTNEDTDGGRESQLIFRGRQSGGERSTLAMIQASHDATGDDQKGDLIFYTNDGDDGDAPTEGMRISSGKQVTLKGSVSMANNTSLLTGVTAGNTLHFKAYDNDLPGNVILATMTSNNNPTWSFSTHILDSTTSPALSACGTAPAIVGGDIGGKVTIGTGATQSCTVTFNVAHANAPACVIAGDNTAVTYAATTSTTVLTITSSADMASDVISYVCIGY